MSHLDIDLSHIQLSPKQERAVMFRSPLHPITDEAQIDNVGFFGDYGGGKSFAMMIRFLLCCLHNNYRPGVHSGDSPPMSGLVAPTASDLKRGPLAELSKILGDYEEQVVVRKVEYGQDQHWELFNGHKILLYSAQGAKNGPTLCQIAADEYQETCYAGQFDNIKGRVRDLRSDWLNVMGSGIAQRGHVEDTFKLPSKDESGLPYCMQDETNKNKLTVLLYPEDNADNMAAGYVEGMQAGGRRGRDKDGWILPDGAFYPSFSRDQHLRMPPGMANVTRRDLTRRPTSVAVDPGQYGAAVLWFQPIDIAVRENGKRKRGRGILIVDQWMPADDADHIAAELSRRPWQIVPEKSVICLDPTMEPDQRRHFSDIHLPGVQLVQHTRGLYHKEANGVRAVQRALQDPEGNQRIYIAPWVHQVTDETAGYKSGKGRRGVVEMFGSYSTKKPKDKWFEHAGDIVRYAVQYACPLPNMAVGVDPEAEKDLSRVRSLTKGVRVSDLG